MYYSFVNSIIIELGETIIQFCLYGILIFIICKIYGKYLGNKVCTYNINNNVITIRNFNEEEYKDMSINIKCIDLLGCILYIAMNDITILDVLDIVENFTQLNYKYTKESLDKLYNKIDVEYSRYFKIIYPCNVIISYLIDNIYYEKIYVNNEIAYSDRIFGFIEYKSKKYPFNFFIENNNHKLFFDKFEKEIQDYIKFIKEKTQVEIKDKIKDMFELYESFT